MTLGQLLAEGTARLESAGIAEAALDARYLLLEAFDLSAGSFLLRRMDEIRDEDARNRYEEMLQQRCGRIPLQYILGSQMFMGLEFFVDERVLIPRQDTEDLVELVLKEHLEKKKKILDMCTGSGCIAISLAKFGGYSQVTAVDISEGALEVTGENARRLIPAVSFDRIQSNLYENEEEIRKKAPEGYDVIVSNPPYIPTKVIEGLQPEVRDFEPKLALDGTEDGLYFYRILAQESSRFLKKGGSLYLEIGHDQGEAVSGLLKEAGYTKIRVVKDTPGLNRIVTAII
ncbi:MAG: peptide chain release factor N(5)-glutamine methyltransferase [Hungatella sp.]